VDDAIARCDVRCHNIGIVDSYTTVYDGNRNVRAIYGFRTGEFDNIRGIHFSRYDVIGQNGDQLIAVFGL